MVFGQRSLLWWDLPLADSFDLLRHVYKVDSRAHRDRLDECTELLQLDEFINTPVRQLSLGQRMRGELTAALLHNPELLFLDEPTVGLDVVSKDRVRTFLADLNARHGTTVLLTTHDLDDIERLCSPAADHRPRPRHLRRRPRRAARQVRHRTHPRRRPRRIGGAHRRRRGRGRQGRRPAPVAALPPRRHDRGRAHRRHRRPLSRCATSPSRNPRSRTSSAGSTWKACRAGRRSPSGLPAITRWRLTPALPSLSMSNQPVGRVLGTEDATPLDVLGRARRGPVPAARRRRRLRAHGAGSGRADPALGGRHPGARPARGRPLRLRRVPDQRRRCCRPRRVEAAEVTTTRVEPEVYVPPRPGAEVQRATGDASATRRCSSTAWSASSRSGSAATAPCSSPTSTSSTAPAARTSTSPASPAWRRRRRTRPSSSTRCSTRACSARTRPTPRRSSST